MLVVNLAGHYWSSDYVGAVERGVAGRSIDWVVQRVVLRVGLRVVLGVVVGNRVGVAGRVVLLRIYVLDGLYGLDVNCVVVASILIVPLLVLVPVVAPTAEGPLELLQKPTDLLPEQVPHQPQQQNYHQGRHPQSLLYNYIPSIEYQFAYSK